jgi:tRNA(fMet)-specific endonuclease VapC
MYLLDTNILSELIKKQPEPNFLKRLRSEPSQVLFTSSLCVFELRFGSALRSDFELFWPKIMSEIISLITVLPFGEKESLIAGDMMADLQRKGRKIGIEDVFIASTALASGFKLVTANVKHYSRIKGLKLENWIEK